MIVSGCFHDKFVLIITGNR